MNVLFCASEAAPFAASGGLGDVAGSLPRAIRNRKVACRVVMPLYGDMKQEYREKLTYITNFTVPVGWRNQYCGLFELTHNGVKYYFLDNEYYFKRTGLYGFYDDGERFAFFSRAILEMLFHVDFVPDVIHANDWQTALVPVYLNLYYRHLEQYRSIKTVFTIHNIQYQGKYGMEILEDTLAIGRQDAHLVEYDGCVNFMKGAIECADKVTTVAGRIDQNIVRFTLQTTFDHSFQIFVFNFKFFEGKVIHVDDKLVIAVLDLSNDLVQILELMLVSFNDTKSLIIILVQDSLDTGGFTCTCITEQQTVVCFSASDKCFCVFDQFLFRDLIAYQVIQTYMCDPCDRNDLCFSILVFLDTESLMKSQLAYAEILIELDHIFHEFLCILGCCQCAAHLADTVADTFVEHLSTVLRCLIVAEDTVAGSMEYFVQKIQVKIIQFLEDCKIMECQLIDASVDMSTDLARGAECILVVHKKQSQIIVPQVSCKSIGTCRLDQTVDTFIEIFFHFFCVYG